MILASVDHHSEELLATVSYAFISLGNVWRYLCYKSGGGGTPRGGNGGRGLTHSIGGPLRPVTHAVSPDNSTESPDQNTGAFLIMLLLCGIGLFLTTGQYTRLEPVHALANKDLLFKEGSATFKGCFKRPDNVTLAFPVDAVIENISVDKCVNMCTEKEFTLAALTWEKCHCGFPTSLFTLHEREDDERCWLRCAEEDFENCGNNDYFIVYQTQVQDNRCMDRRFLPIHAEHLIALASFPGSGNTWTRHLIELATGVYTGSCYFDKALYIKGFIGEKDDWRSGETICVKTHENSRTMIQAFDSSILLIRNPYKALMSEFNRQYGGGHIGFAAEARWSGKDWPVFVKKNAPWWASHTQDWLKYGKKVHVVHYEDLKRDVFSHLKKMVLFLGLEVSEDRLLCMEGQKDGNFKRSGEKPEYDPYTAEMRANIDELIKTVDTELKKRNLTAVPEEYRPR